MRQEKNQVKQFKKEDPFDIDQSIELDCSKDITIVDAPLEKQKNRSLRSGRYKHSLNSKNSIERDPKKSKEKEAKEELTISVNSSSSIKHNLR